MIEYEGVVRSVAGRKATIVVKTGGCSSCGHLSGCGLGRLASGDGEGGKEISLVLDQVVVAGDRVTLGLSRERMFLGGL